MIYEEIDNIIIRDVDFVTTEDFKGFVSDIMIFMQECVDPEIETSEAVSKAIENGFCIEIVCEEKRVGVLVINRGCFDTFQPKYHLAYIAVDKEFQGKGIGRKLLEIASKVTENSIALHVGLNNKNAIEFYKKMGWKETYVRMMPKK